MENKKISNLLRAVADLMDQTTEVVVETQKEIIPAVIKGTKKIMPANKIFWLLPGTIELNIFPPISPGNEEDALKQKCYQLMKENL